jgi:outer membrane murein-binding lipoprotein Lpp
MRARVLKELQLAAFVFTLFCAGCSGSQKTEQIQQSLQSWSRSIDFAEQQWRDHRVPDTYLAQLLRAAGQEQKKQQQEINKASRSGASVTAVQAQLRGVESKIAEANRELALKR